MNGNYDLTYRSDNLVIEKRNASVTPDDKSKSYGDQILHRDTRPS